MNSTPRRRAARCPCRSARSGAASERRNRRRATRRRLTPRISNSSVGGSTATMHDEDRGLDDRRKRVADVQCSRNVFVGNEAQKLEERRRRRERADAERIEEIRDEADRDRDRGGKRAGQRRRGGAASARINATISTSATMARPTNRIVRTVIAQTVRPQRAAACLPRAYALARDRSRVRRRLEAASSRTAAALKYAARGWCMTMRRGRLLGHDLKRLASALRRCFASRRAERKTISCCSRSGHAP